MDVNFITKGTKETKVLGSIVTKFL